MPFLCSVIGRAQPEETDCDRCLWPAPFARHCYHWRGLAHHRRTSRLQWQPRAQLLKVIEHISEQEAYPASRFILIKPLRLPRIIHRSNESRRAFTSSVTSNSMALWRCIETSRTDFRIAGNIADGLQSGQSGCCRDRTSKTKQ